MENNEKEEKSTRKTMSALEKQVEREKTKMQLEKAKAVATQKSKFFDPIIYSQLKIVAEDFIKGGAISADAATPQQMIIKLQAGFELGLSPIEALNSLYIVGGRVNFWGAAMVKRLRMHGWRIQFKDETQESCTAVVSKGDETYEETLTFQDAQKSGYTTGKSGLKFGWKEGSSRRLKLRYGALTNLIKTYIPEVLGTASGIQEYDGDLEIQTLEEQQKEKVEAVLEQEMKPIDATFTPIVKDKKEETDAQQV